MKNIRYKILESEDGKCPYCRSEYVMEVTGEENDAVRHYFPQGNFRIFKCYACNKYFFTAAGN